MSLKSFEINYGFNGEPSTASASFVVKKKECADIITTPAVGTLGVFLPTGRSEIDQLSSNFIVSQTTEKKEGGFSTYTYELVDESAKRLESIAVLVRGITAPAISSELDDYRQIFPMAETDLAVALRIGKLGLTSVILKGQIAVIGRTFSVVSAVSGGESGTRFYAGGEIVGQAPQNTFSANLNNALDIERKNATLQYGYYLSDLKNLLIMAGYSVVGYPEDQRFILMNFGGSLRDVVSSLASMFGLSWYIRGSVITFLTYQALSAHPIPSFVSSADSRILSASYSKDLAGKSSVGVVFGSSEPTISTSFTRSGRPRSIKFYYVGLERVFGKSTNLFKSLWTFFLFSGSQDAFDKIILLLLARKNEAVTQEAFIELYGAEQTEGDKKTLGEVEINETRQNAIKAAHKHLESYDELYPLTSTEGGSVKNPSDTALYGALETASKALGSLYLSIPVTETFKENNALAANEGVSVYGPYLGTTEIQNVPELSGVSELLDILFDRENKPPITIRQLYDASRPTRNSESILQADSSYHYIALKDILADFADADADEDEPNVESPFRQAKDAVDLAVADTSGANWTYNETSYCCSNSDEWKKILTMANTSKAMADRVLKEKKKQIRLFAAEIGSDQSDGSEEQELIASDYVSFKVRGETRPYSAVEVLRFEGTNDEAEYLASNFSKLIGGFFQPESSTVSYSGFVTPEDTPILSSVSFSFSENGVDTTISYSNKEFVAESDSVLMSGYSVNTTKRANRALKARQKNVLGIR